MNVEVDAYTYRELKNTSSHEEIKKEMRWMYAIDTLKTLADQVIATTEEHCQKILNTEIEVLIEVEGDGSFEVEVFIGKIGTQKLPHSSQFNACPHIRASVDLVEDIQLFKRVLTKLKFNGEYESVQLEMGEIIGTRTRELNYEIVSSVKNDFGGDCHQVHSDNWAEVMAVQHGHLFTREGRVIKGALNYSQSQQSEEV
jgi:hypothetical protein